MNHHNNDTTIHTTSIIPPSSSSPNTKQQQQLQPPKSLRIALVCDFFYPRLGGVEMHIWSLSQQLIRLGHKVIIITHAYNNSPSATTAKRRKSKRTGVRYLPGPIKVYYCPILPMTDEDAYPSFTATLPLFRWILIREGINLVHAHQATSTMANEAVVYAAELGLPSVYTDHSLFGFDDVASLILNRVLKTTLSTVSSVICVSHTCRDNFIMRVNMDPSIVHAIPNAVDTSKFIPDPSRRVKDRIKVIVISRLVYRKGVDLLVGIIPQICSKYHNVDFIIGGDGAKRLALEEMVERERLQDRVDFLGAVPHDKVRDVLVKGHVFLNCSLTESFCIALLEAASCGLFAVSTNVGGVPEVLPPDMAFLSEPNVSSLVQNLSRVIDENITTQVNPFDFHNRVKQMYSWRRVARDTVTIYNHVLYKQPRLTFLERLNRYVTVGSVAGLVACILAVTLHFYVMLVEWMQPRENIDVVPDIGLCSEKELSRYCENGRHDSVNNDGDDGGAGKKN